MDILSYLLGKKAGGTPIPPIPPTPILPDGYTQVAWITSSGTQYIDTGYKIKQNTTIKLLGWQTRAGGLFGARIGTSEDTYYVSAKSFKESGVIVGGYFQFCYGDTSNVETTINTLTYSYITISKNQVKVNDITYSDINITNTPDFNLYLFAINTNGTASAFTTGCIGEFKIYEGDTLILNYIPCIRDSDSEVGFYDTVSETFITNSGTGTFNYQPLI